MFDKKKVYEYVNGNAKTPLSKLFETLVIFLIIGSIIVVVLESVPLSPLGYEIVSILNISSIIVFTIEYFIRLWVSDLMYPKLNPVQARIKYALTPMALVDLLAIIPFYMPFLFPFDLRTIRMIRLVKIFRIFNLNQYTHGFYIILSVLRDRSAQLISSLFVVTILILMSAITMYNIENAAQPTVFKSALSGIWWAVCTLTTVGYGDIYPITFMGKFFAAIISLLGIGLVAIPTGIISSGFIEATNKEHNKEHKHNIHYCPNCGVKLPE